MPEQEIGVSEQEFSEVKSWVELTETGFPRIASPAFATSNGTPYLRAPGVALLSKPQVQVANLSDFLGGFDPKLRFPQYLDDPTPLPPGAQICKAAGQVCFDDQTEVLTEEGWKLFAA